MRICIVPMKPLAEAKERLAPILGPHERRRLSLAMLADVLAATVGFDRVWVLHSDDDAAAEARKAGAEPRPDPAPGRGLNASLDGATGDAIAAGATGVCVVSADLAAASAEDLDRLAQGEGVALAPDQAGSGTNALWRRPADIIAAAFGPQSRQAHEAAALDAGAAFRILESPRLAVDVDTSDALSSVWALGPGPATRHALEEMEIPARLRLAG